MPMDPISFWMQASVFWARVFKQQHEAYLRMLGAMAVQVPHPDAAELSKQAQAMSPANTPKRPAAPKRSGIPASA